MLPAYAAGGAAWADGPGIGCGVERSEGRVGGKSERLGGDGAWEGGPGVACKMQALPGEARLRVNRMQALPGAWRPASEGGPYAGWEAGGKSRPEGRPVRWEGYEAEIFD
jgi:hypothetical protein